jgi:hypothetical protein
MVNQNLLSCLLSEQHLHRMRPNSSGLTGASALYRRNLPLVLRIWQSRVRRFFSLPRVTSHESPITKSFRMRSSGQIPRFATFWPKLSVYNPFRMRRSAKRACNSFRMRRCKKKWG